MSSIHSKNTKPELLLATELRNLGLKYRRYYSIDGKPDFAFPKEKVAVFCDGDFWHGNNWRIRGHKKLEDDLKTNKQFWINKIKNNINRDKRVNIKLKKKKWRVLRFWESDIKQNTLKYALRVKNIIERKRH